MLEDRMKWSDVHTLFCVTGTMQTDMGETGDVAFKHAKSVPVQVPNKLKNSLDSIYTVVVVFLKNSVILTVQKIKNTSEKTLHANT